MHPPSLLSYYPTYALLDEICSIGHFKKLNLFIDLKNTMQAAYMEHSIINVIENSKNSDYMDTSIFSSLLAFLSFHKIYSIKRGVDINFTIFFETGQSYYHKNISKKYKISRRIDDLFGLEREDRELYYETLQGNLKLVEKACNKMPGIQVVRVPNLEADFVPYYLITRNIIKQDDSVGNVIYSNDHDMWQCLNDNTFIFSKSSKTKKLIRKGNTLKMLLKKECHIPDEYLPLAMAVIGDVGDDVIGVKGVGPSNFLKIFEQLVAMTGNMEDIFKKVENRQPLFNFIPSSIENKKLKSVVDAEVNDNTISNNLKLVSFELLSRELENPSRTEIIDKRNIIEKQFLTEKEIYPLESMKTALQRNGVFLEESSIDFLYI